MWRKKKLIIVAVLVATVVLICSVGGVALAQTENTDNTTPGKALLARVAAILGIEQQQVEDAFAQAQSEMQEEALDNYLEAEQNRTPRTPRTDSTASTQPAERTEKRPS